MDREALETRAAELRVKVQASMKDTTLANRIKKAEEAKAAKNTTPQTGGAGAQSGAPASAPSDDPVIAVAIYPVTHDGEDFAPGEEFFCSERERDALVASGAAQPADDD